MRILYVVPYTPTPIRVRPYNLLRALCRRGHQVTLATLWERPDEQAALAALAEAGCNVVAYRLARGQILRNLLTALPSRTPLQARYCWQPALAHALAIAVRDQEYDVVQVEHLRGAPFALHLQDALSRQAATPLQGAAQGRPVPVVWDAVDCISHLFSQAAQASRSLRGRAVARLELPLTRRYEARLLRRFAATLVTSAMDRDAMLKLMDDAAALAARVHVIPNGVDLDYFSPAPAAQQAAAQQAAAQQAAAQQAAAQQAAAQQAAAQQVAALVVTGKMSYHANVSMVLHLVHDLMPAVWAQRPDVQLYVVGKDPPPAVGRLDPAWTPTRPAPAMGAGVGRVVVTGGVDDLRPYLRQGTVAVAPVPYGAGIQNKVLEAMACAAPVVASRQGVAALDVRAGVELLVADGAPAFADAVLHLLDDAELRARLGAAARRYVEAHHTWDNAVQRLEMLYHGLSPTA